MRIPRPSPPTVVFFLATAIVLAAALGRSFPAPHIFLLVAVAWASARGGLSAGMIATAFAVAAMLVASTLHGGRFTSGLALEDVLSTASYIAVTFVVGGLRQQLDDARAVHGRLRLAEIAADEKLSRVLESITDGFLTLDSNWHITYVNRRGEAMLGKSREALLDRYILDAFPEGVGSTIHREIDRARREMMSTEFEAFYPAGNRWFEVRGYPAQDGSMTVYFRDVTKRKRAQRAMMQQARMLDSVRQTVIAVEPDGIIFYWNHAAQELLGWRADQVVGRTTIAITHLDIDPDESEELLKRVQAGERATAETMLRRRDGSTFPATIDDSPIVDEDGAVLGMVRIITDLSDRQAHQHAQQFLEKAGSELSSTLDFDALMDAVALLAVPTLADACVLDLTEEESEAHRMESTWSEALSRGGPPRFTQRNFSTPSTAISLLSDGEATLITRISDSVLRSITSSPEELDRLRKAGVRSAVVAPLTAGGRLLGTLSTISTTRVYTKADCALIAEFARRVALAADNALLYGTARIASKAKSDFLAVMSHELRTPLTTVMGYTDLLLAEVSGALTDKSRNYIDRIRVAAWHLLGLIEQILIYTRVEVGREQVHSERIPLEYVLRDAAALIEPVAAEKGLNFRLAPLGSADFIDTDITKLRQILLNLLSNAVKFTDEGAVTLEAEVVGDVVEFRVTDTGVGIAAEHLERIFDSFWQVDQSATRRAGGTGLGLSVARNLARLLGGDVSVTSEAGQGSVFKLTLPQRSKTPAAVAVLA